MKRIVKYLIPCLVACFMVFGLVQTASFTFAEVQDDQTTQVDDSGTNYVLGNPNGNLDDNSGASGGDTTLDGSDDNGTSEEGDDAGDDEENPILLNEDEESEDDPINSSAPNETVDLKPVYSKVITDKGNDNYSLELNVVGATESITGEKPKVDVLLIIDISYSMSYATTYNGKTVSRLSALQDILTNTTNGFTKEILGDTERIDGRISVVDFRKNAEIDLNWSDSLSAANNAINALTPDDTYNKSNSKSGTNPHAGLLVATKQIASMRSDASKYVILLSDGEPNYSCTKCNYSYCNRNHITDVAGNNYHYDSTYNVRNRAIEQASKISGINQFYTIGYSKDTTSSGTFMTNLANAPANNIGASNCHYYQADNADVLANVFANIAASSTNFDIKNVVIEDTLSDYVEFVDTDTSKIKILDETTNTYLDGVTIEINGKTIKATFPSNYSLIKDHKYSLKFDVKVTNSAYEAYIVNNGYTDKGGEGTGKKSENCDGFFSNTTAQLHYTISSSNGSQSEVQTATYNKPVVQINTVDIPVTKNWIDADNKDLNVDELGLSTVEVSLNTEIGDTLYTVNTTDVAEDLTTKKWTGTFETVPMNPTGTFPVYSITDEVDGFVVSESEIGKKDNSFNATITNKKNPTLTITKNVTGAFGNKEGNFNITVTLQNKDGSDFVGTFYKGTENEIEFKAGVATIKLGNGKSVDFNLPFGTKYKVVETTDSSTGYNVGYTIDSKDASFSDFVTLDNNDHVVVTNNKEAVPITGLIDNTPKGLGMIGTIVAEVVAIAFVLKKKKQLKM